MLVIPGRVLRFTSTTAAQRPRDSTRARHTDTVLIARQLLFSIPIVWARVIDFFGYSNVYEVAAPRLVECLMLGWEVGTQ